MMPTTNTTPSRDCTLIDVPVRYRTGSTPTSPSGTPASTTSGTTYESNRLTIRK